MPDERNGPHRQSVSDLLSVRPRRGRIKLAAVSQLLIEAMEDMKLTYPKPHLNVPALKKSLMKAA